MATILAIDASTEVCSATVLRDGICSSLHSDEPRAHAQALLPMIDELLKQGGIGLSSVDVIAYGSGPGSFTGLRIGLGIAQGLAFGAGLPMAGISSLAAMAVARCPPRSGIDERFICVIDARMNELYWSMHSVSRSETLTRVHTVIAPRLDSIVDANREISTCLNNCEPGKVTIAGSGAMLLDVSQRGNFPGLELVVEADATPSAVGVALIAKENLAAGVVVNAEDAQLAYLRNSVAWNKRVRVRRA